jgi:hypothetical protein
MRRGDFAVEVVPDGRARVRELDSGHVLARPGTVYRLRLRNLGPLNAVADIAIDGRTITQSGLVLRPFSVTELERPVAENERGRFTVAAEGDESAFGPDGGRDNDALGLIDARFRRELPDGRYRDDVPGMHPLATVNRFGYLQVSERIVPTRSPIDGLLASRLPGESREAPRIERAAGTGLSGHSNQEFAAMALGALETEATVIQLRLVIGSEASIDEASERDSERPAPSRPAARP